MDSPNLQTDKPSPMVEKTRKVMEAYLNNPPETRHLAVQQVLKESLADGSALSPMAPLK